MRMILVKGMVALRVKNTTIFNKIFNKTNTER